jgi:lipopolysaccharide export system protein LptC
VQGSRITLDNPKLTGYRKDGRPYELTARVGVQDLSKPDLFELEGVAATLDSGPGQAVMLTANAGFYNTKTDQADLFKGVRIFDDKSYDLRLEKALLDLRANTLKSDRPGKLLMSCCEVEGNTVELAQGEQRVTFVGAVRSVFYGEKDEDQEKPAAP